MDKYIIVCGNTSSCYFNKKMQDIMIDMINDKNLDEWNQWSNKHGMWRTIVDDKIEFNMIISDQQKQINRIDSRFDDFNRGSAKLLSLLLLWCFVNTLIHLIK